MNKLNLTVISSEETKNGNFLNKLRTKTKIETETIFGITERETQSTYYLFTTTPNEVGTVGELDIELFDVVLNDFTNPDTGEIMQLKYLRPKA